MMDTSKLKIHAEGEVRRSAEPHPTDGQPCPTCGKAHIDTRTDQEKKSWPSG